MCGSVAVVPPGLTYSGKQPDQKQNYLLLWPKTKINGCLTLAALFSLLQLPIAIAF